jgi:hypothetical protein
MVTAPSNWRQLPADTVEEIITRHAGHYPPSFEALVELLERHRYAVEQTTGGEATTYHHTRRVLIPHARPDWMLVMLMHETAECLLRLPVEAEFVHPLTCQDEYHNVAGLTVKRLQKRLLTECNRLLEEEIAAELAVSASFIAWQEQGQALVEAGRAMLAGVALVRFPDPATVLVTQQAYTSAVERLKGIQARLRYFGR